MLSFIVKNPKRLVRLCLRVCKLRCMVLLLAIFYTHRSFSFNSIFSPASIPVKSGKNFTSQVIVWLMMITTVDLEPFKAVNVLIVSPVNSKKICKRCLACI